MENLNQENTATNTVTEQVQETNTNTNTNSNDELLNKLDELLAKREDRLAKSILKDNGLQDDEAKDLLTQWKESRTAKKEKATNDYNELKAKYEALEKEMTTTRINTVATKIAKELNIEEASLKHVMKLADNSEFVKDGNIQEEKIKEQFEAVLKDVPAFATKKVENNSENENGTGFKNVGNTKEVVDDEMAKYRKILGLPEKK